jgi:L-ascorbate metabolism protein UlaG (beta-lactamase superfamily)
VCHACVIIDTGDCKLVTDPWSTGSSYCGQWHLFPRPVNTERLNETEAVLLSHGHEDHLHEASLRALPKTVPVFYPYSWYGGTKQFIEAMGFRDVIEAFPQKVYRVGSRTIVTYLVNSLDSIIVIESGGKVLVNINDALHSYPTKIIDVFLKAILERWPKIDTVLCGFGGASYFPNTIHCPGKNDVEIAEAREQLFAHNFCKIVNELRPTVAVPFAADFVLLGDRQRWINNVRFPRALLADYCRRIYGDHAASRIEPMYSGDVLIDDELVPVSPYRQQMRNHSLSHLIDEQYDYEIAEKRVASWVSETEAESLRRAMLSNIKSRANLYSPDKLNQANFSVQVSDVRHNSFYNVRFQNGEPLIERGANPAAEVVLVLETSSQILSYSFSSEWGGDAITIGYGCEIRVLNQDTIAGGVDIMCVRLLTRQPPASRHWKVEPIRVARHLLSSPTTRKWAVRAVLNRSSQYSEKRNNDVLREWLFRSKCEVCRACDLPLLDEHFAATL